MTSEITQDQFNQSVTNEINRVDKWLSDPVNNLTSRLEGRMFLKRDVVSCMEKRVQVIATDPFFIKVPPTVEEKTQVRELNHDIKLMQQAVDMIKKLKEQLDNAKL